MQKKGKKGDGAMGRLSNNRIITSIDVGTTKICVLIARVLDNQQLEIIGVGKSPSQGLYKGVVVDVAKTIYSIRSAVQEAELMANMPVESAVIGIAGGHISSINSHGVVAIKRGEIRCADIDNVLAAARAIPIAPGQQILHVLPQYFIIDGRQTVHDPLGMHGIRLEVCAHIIMGSVASVQNVVRCCEQADVQVSDIVLEQLASADSVLSDDERMLGVAMLDIGGGTSDLAVYHQGSIRHTMVLPIAGNHFTHDLAVGLRTTVQEAERIKKEYGLAYMDLLQHNTLIEIEQVQGNDLQVVHVHDLVSILQPRAQELLKLVQKEIIAQKVMSYISTGLVLTGGGSLLHGMRDLAEDIFDMPVRIGNPHIAFDLPESLYSPLYATGYGLLVYALKKQKQNSTGLRKNGLSYTILDRMKSWIVDLF